MIDFVSLSWLPKSPDSQPTSTLWSRRPAFFRTEEAVGSVTDLSSLTFGNLCTHACLEVMLLAMLLVTLPLSHFAVSHSAQHAKWHSEGHKHLQRNASNVTALIQGVSPADDSYVRPPVAPAASPPASAPLVSPPAGPFAAPAAAAQSAAPQFPHFSTAFPPLPPPSPPYATCSEKIKNRAEGSGWQQRQ